MHSVSGRTKGFIMEMTWWLSLEETEWYKTSLTVIGEYLQHVYISHRKRENATDLVSSDPASREQMQLGTSALAASLGSVLLTVESLTVHQPGQWNQASIISDFTLNQEWLGRPAQDSVMESSLLCPKEDFSSALGVMRHRCPLPHTVNPWSENHTVPRCLPQEMNNSDGFFWQSEISGTGKKKWKQIQAKPLGREKKN